jgi:hypothetical protein
VEQYCKYCHTILHNKITEHYEVLFLSINVVYYYSRLELMTSVEIPDQLKEHTGEYQSVLLLSASSLPIRSGTN